MPRGSCRIRGWGLVREGLPRAGDDASHVAGPGLPGVLAPEAILAFGFAGADPLCTGDLGRGAGRDRTGLARGSAVPSISLALGPEIDAGLWGEKTRSCCCSRPTRCSAECDKE